MRRLSAGKRDANEQIIFEAFEAAGCSVLPISKKGAPDAVVFCHGRPGFPVEVKARLGKLTKHQIAFHKAWRGPEIQIVRDVESALKLAKG